ncbi:hypothetical protein [Streptomyces antibioticus]|uniref:Uncharacterized protein n=1 Tax=Streptomyces antibioticus TaxID=1890 RepID=A0AAE7CNN8_STRAT|nr:hypothetical protein [Streptomyces antibioticus]QIT47599.1 hypothetical protein HCX60_32090 [Streptomyces antibioticus]
MSEPITLSDARALMAENDAGRFIKTQMADAQRAAAHRRALVLRHPDLAEQLTKPPINHARPDVWTGYIPPATDCTGAINTAACRPALLALIAEAKRRTAPVQKGQAA